MSSKRKVIEDVSRKLNRTGIRVVDKLPTNDAVSGPLLTDRQVSAITGLDRVTLYRLRNSRQIGFYKFGKVIRYSEDHIRDFLQKHEKNVRDHFSPTG
jgi:predicted DNA-binding transcriptional regulator AlpA